jgi:hypothetical protein
MEVAEAYVRRTNESSVRTDCPGSYLPNKKKRTLTTGLPDWLVHAIADTTGTNRNFFVVFISVRVTSQPILEQKQLGKSVESQLKCVIS